jgi:serine/threonine protein kinase
MPRKYQTPPAPSPQRNQEQAPVITVSSLLARSDAMLKEVEQTDVVRENRRKYPTFASTEVKLGPMLGQGGFGIVFEVSSFEFEESAAATNASVESPDIARAQNSALDACEALEDEPHYDVGDARQLMKDRARRNGDARYAIKRVKETMKGVTKVQAMIDLAVEATYLSALSHPNIVKMRATSDSKMVSRSFFIVMDRLYDTLAVRLKAWKATHTKYRGGFFGRGANLEELHSLLVERLTVAYDLASAYRYLHDNKIVYRDIRKENIGFDVRGDVKIFDFGLSKSLSPRLKCKNKDGKEVYGYHLTPCTGSIPFMAPEIVQRLPYDTKCDVFSFGILLWEMLALKPAFGGGLSPHEYRQRVVFLSERPSIRRDWPESIKTLLRTAWDESPQNRPTMTNVAATIRSSLNPMTADPAVRHRSVFLMDRSALSFRVARATAANARPVSTAA